MSAMPSAKIRAVDMRVLDKVFDMEGGHVLDFSLRTYAGFFCEELRVDIDDPRWAVEGGRRRSACATTCDKRTPKRSSIR